MHRQAQPPATAPAHPRAAAPDAEPPNNKFPSTAPSARRALRARVPRFALRQETRCLPVRLRPQPPWPSCWSSRFCRSDEVPSVENSAAKQRPQNFRQQQIWNRLAADSRSPDVPPHPRPARAIVEPAARLRNGSTKFPARSWCRSPPRSRAPSASARCGPGEHLSAVRVMRALPTAKAGGSELLQAS